MIKPCFYRQVVVMMFIEKSVDGSS